MKKSLAQVAYEAKWGDCEGFRNERVQAAWQAVADAVVSAHKAGERKPDELLAKVEAYLRDLWKDMPPKIDERLRYREVQFSDGEVGELYDLLCEVTKARESSAADLVASGDMEGAVQ